jgi:hypothetical protein
MLCQNFKKCGRLSRLIYAFNDIDLVMNGLDCHNQVFF